MVAFREDIERIEVWLNLTGLSEAELGQLSAENPEALAQLRAGTATPATVLKLTMFTKTQWPELFACSCASGQMKWQDEKARFFCDNCQSAMTPASNRATISNLRSTLTTEEAWRRAPAGTEMIAIG